jgi:hypothetical protein
MLRDLPGGARGACRQVFIPAPGGEMGSNSLLVVILILFFLLVVNAVLLAVILYTQRKAEGAALALHQWRHHVLQRGVPPQPEG